VLLGSIWAWYFITVRAGFGQGLVLWTCGYVEQRLGLGFSHMFLKSYAMSGRTCGHAGRHLGRTLTIAPGH
jgi:hypothetical protein